MAENKFLIKPRDIIFKCKNPTCYKYNKEATIQVGNIYKNDIKELLNCLSCGENNIEIVKIAIPKEKIIAV